jgi:hypothetical protein
VTALLVVDPYNNFISEGGKIWPRIKAVAEANNCVPHPHRRWFAGLGPARTDKIIVGAAPQRLPQRLIEQLKPGGKMVLPLGVGDDQKLVVVEKGQGDQVRTTELIAVRFSPLIASH